MSTSQASSVDIDNPALTTTTTTTTHKKWGEAKSTPVGKRFEVHSQTSLQKTQQQRSFGEISNTLDRGYEGTRTGDNDKKIQQQQQQPTLVCQSVSEESEFIPIITSKEDYSDILPPSLCLSRDQLTDFTRFWKNCQKPDIQEIDIPASPPPDLSFLPLIHLDEPKIRLEPLPEDLFDLPPPWE